jgi:hypothetical protein
MTGVFLRRLPVNDLDLHADAEDWDSNRDGEVCAECGGPRVVYIPAWENGSGVLTVEEIAAVLKKARLDIKRLAEEEKAGKFPPRTDALPDDIVLRIDGRRDGSFRAVILAEGGSWGQTNNKYGAGSVYRGAAGWRHGLAISTYVTELTTGRDSEEGRRVYEGEPGVLNFTYRSSDKTGAEELRLRRALRDRTSRTTAWDRHVKGMQLREAEGGDVTE